MVSLTRRLSAMAFAGSLVTAIHAQSPSCEYSIVVTVTGKQGPISALPGELFQVKVAGDHATVNSTEPAQLRRVQIAIDISGSMEDRRDATSHTLSTLLRALPEGTQVGLMVFADNIHVLAPIGSKRDALWQSWLDLPDFNVKERKKKRKKDDPPDPARFGKGRTVLRDAILGSVELLEQPSSDDTVFVITDGGDNRSQSKEKKLVQLLRDSQLRLAVLLFRQPNPATPEEFAGPAMLRSLANIGGGMVAEVQAFEGGPDPAEAEAAADWLVQGLIFRQKLVLEFQKGISKPKSLRVALVKDSGIKNGRIYYPEKLNPCTAATASAQ